MLGCAGKRHGMREMGREELECGGRCWDGGGRWIGEVVVEDDKK